MNFEKLVNKKKYQVFVFASPVFLPLSFAIHPWIVTNSKGKLNRWEVWQLKNCCETSWGHVHLNLFKPFIGVNVFPFFRNPRWGTSLVGRAEGDVAKRVINFLDKEAKNYKFKGRYWFFPGPNSNTFVNWVLCKFPELGVNLGWRAFGKNYLK